MSVLVAGCGGDAASRPRAGGTSTGGAEEDKVTLQLKWVTQAQFAGYYAALAKGYYEEEGLDVDDQGRRPGHHPGAGRARRSRPSSGSTGCRACSPRATRAATSSTSRRSSRASGMTELTWKDIGHHDDRPDEGQEGRRLVLRQRVRALRRADEERDRPEEQGDVTIVKQPFDMDLFLKNQVDAAAAMTYNELAQVLETKNPKTGKLYKLSDLNVIKMEERRHRHARGRHLRPRRLDHEQGTTRRSPSGSSPASLQGLDLLPRPPGRVHADRARQRADARRGPPDLADERDQRADLAGGERASA